MMSKVTDNVGGSGALAPLSSSLPPNLFDDLWSAITAPSVTADLNTALSDLNDFFATLFSDPKDLGSRGVSDLISAAQAVVDFVIDLLDSIVSKIIDLVSTALGVAADILTQPLGEIPIVSWLYTNVVCPSDQQEQLSILRLACLVLALPVTLIYKAANSGNPPFDQATTNQILSWTFTPPGTSSAVRPDPATLGDPSVLAKVAAYLCQCRRPARTWPATACRWTGRARWSRRRAGSTWSSTGSSRCWIGRTSRSTSAGTGRHSAKRSG